MLHQRNYKFTLNTNLADSVSDAIDLTGLSSAMSLHPVAVSGAHATHAVILEVSNDRANWITTDQGMAQLTSLNILPGTNYAPLACQWARLRVLVAEGAASVTDFVICVK